MGLQLILTCSESGCCDTFQDKALGVQAEPIQLTQSEGTDLNSTAFCGLS